MRLDLRDPNGKIYVYCTWISVIAILATSVFIFCYLIVMAPSEGHTLSEGESAPGVAWTVICAAIFLVCLALLLKDFVGRLKGCPREECDPRFMRAPLSKAGILMAVTAFTTIVILLFSELIGEGISSDFMNDLPTYQLMAVMLIAGPEEELICRALLIGVPMALICLIARQKGVLKNILGGFGMSRAALVLLIISSVIFGLIHLDGWSIMKFPDTFISGMLFGYVYVQYGIHATIVMHSTFDMLASLDLLMEGAGTVPLIILSILGFVLLLRSLLRIREYIPKNNLNEPFEGGLLQMWERD